MVAREHTTNPEVTANDVTALTQTNTKPPNPTFFKSLPESTWGQQTADG
jgi:hypothetical protein